jgi:hypothetical protein
MGKKPDKIRKSKGGVGSKTARPRRGFMTRLSFSVSAWFTVAVDLVSCVLVGTIAIALSPLHILRGFDKFFLFGRVLAPLGLLTTGIRTVIDSRLGYHDRVVAQLEGMIAHLEKVRRRSKHRAPMCKLVLIELYTAMVRAYMQTGHMDDAMLVIIRAYNSLGVKRLRGLGELDIRTAHIVRAGISAGRLLDDGGMAAMLVRSSSQQPKKKKQGRQGAGKKDQSNAAGRKAKKKKLGTVIPLQEYIAAKHDSSAPPS